MLKEAQVEKALDILPRGAFLTTGKDGKYNTMTIGWGNIGVVWGKPTFTVLVRSSRHTYGLIESSGEFTVSLPLTDMKDALNLCGSKSGRDIDKFQAAGLRLQPGRTVNTPVIAGGGLHYECKVVYKQAMQPELMSDAMKKQWYPQEDYHTLYFGEITAVYSD